jgi:hypothetical protein
MRCYQQATGAWRCTCEAPNADRTYLVDGAAGLDACAVGAALCAGAAPTPPLDVGACALYRQESGKNGDLRTCSAELQCLSAVPVDFAPGVRVTTPGGGVADCKEIPGRGKPSSTQSSVRVDCNAAGSLGSQSYKVVANGMASACLPVVEFYLGSKEPKFDGSKACIDGVIDTGSRASCQIEEACFDSAALSDGVSLVKDPASTRATFCGFDDLNNLRCGCTFENGVGRLEAISYDLGPGVRPAKCDLSGCSLEMRAEPTGPGACQEGLESSQHDEDSCSAYFFCIQPATLGAREVKLDSQLNVRCARAADQSFYCGCAVGEETATFRLGNAGSSAAACSAAGNACLEHLALPLGPAPTAGPAPDPIVGP